MKIANLLKKHQDRLKGLASGQANPAAREKLEARISASEPNWTLIDALATRLGMQLAIRASDECLNDRLTDARPLHDGWELILLGWKGNELDFLREAKRLGDEPAFRANVATSDYSGFLIQSWSLCGLYLINPEAPIIDWVRFFEAANVRDPAVNPDRPSYRLQIPLLRALCATNQAAAIAELSAREPFGRLAASWQNDDAFRDVLNEATQWHLEQCEASARDPNVWYHQEPFALFPTWLLALDKCREQKLGRSCLPANDLMAIARKITKVSLRGTPDPAVRSLRESISRNLGAVSGEDALKFWRMFVKTAVPF